MNRRLSSISSFALLLLLVVGIERAQAQTVAVGPYYATPSWDQKLACTNAANCPRFVVLSNWNSEAVLDRETGLVWEREPSQGLLPFDDAHLSCNDKTIGGRRGWRVPRYQDLSSLVDPSVLAGPVLPPGHPFEGVLGNEYWSATTTGVNPTAAWALDFGFGGRRRDLKTVPKLVWCVRGGQGVDAQ